MEKQWPSIITTYCCDRPRAILRSLTTYPSFMTRWGRSLLKYRCCAERSTGKDSAYVSANLATAYAKAGFIADARHCLEQVSVAEQQESIVQAAYRTIKAQTESERQITAKLDALVKLQQHLFGTSALAELNKTDEELLQCFVGEWQMGKSTAVQITIEAGKLSGTISAENSYYEVARYQVTTEINRGCFSWTPNLRKRA